LIARVKSLGITQSCTPLDDLRTSCFVFIRDEALETFSLFLFLVLMTDKIENCLSALALAWGKLKRVRKNLGKYGKGSFPAASLKRNKAN
jgi:hypothetical protein